jgi:hypothetical protein
MPRRSKKGQGAKAKHDGKQFAQVATAAEQELVLKHVDGSQIILEDTTGWGLNGDGDESGAESESEEVESPTDAKVERVLAAMRSRAAKRFKKYEVGYNAAKQSAYREREKEKGTRAAAKKLGLKPITKFFQPKALCNDSNTDTDMRGLIDSDSCDTDESGTDDESNVGKGSGGSLKGWSKTIDKLEGIQKVTFGSGEVEEHTMARALHAHFQRA